MKFSSKALRCQQSPMRKFHPYAVAAAAAGKKIYHLNIGQPDIQTPKQLFDAVRNFHEPTLAYAPSPGIPALIDAICSYYARIGVSGRGECARHHGRERSAPDRMQLYSGRRRRDHRSGAVLSQLPYLYHHGRRQHPSAAYPPEEGYFFADRAKLEDCITPNTRAIMITNPGNPTGTCLTRDEMKMILDVAVEHDLYLIADEVYREFAYETGELLSFLQFGYGYENLILIDSVSKRFSACGARIGCLISRNVEFMAQALKYCQARLSVATLDQVAAAALYSVGPEYFAAVREEYHRRRDTVVRKLHEIPGVVCECPKGAFYLMAALPVDDAEKFQQWLLEEFDDHGDTVMFAAGGPFYATPGKGLNEIRIAYVLKQEDLERAMDLLALGIQKYNETHK